MATVMPWVGLVAAYLAGSTPFALLAGKLLKGIDLRQHGSGNLGATNVYRMLGAPAALVVFVLDAAKGGVPTWAFARWFGAPEGVAWASAFGVAAIAGHVRPYFGLMKGGGKGVATAAGVFAALSPQPFGVAITAFVLLVAVTRFVSVGSMVGAAVLAVVSAGWYGMGALRTWMAVAIASFVIWNHRANIGRLRRGEEPRLGRPAAGAR